MRNRMLLALGMLAIVLAVFGCGGGAPATLASPTLAPAAPTLAAAVEPTSVPATESAPTAASALATKNPTSASTVAAATTAPATAGSASGAPPSGNPLDILVNAQSGQQKAKSFRTTVVTTSGKTNSTTIVVEYLAPDRVHSILPNGVEMIAIKGQGTWQKAGGKWTKSPADMSAVLFAFQDPKVIEEIRKSIVVDQIKLVGADMLNGQPMWVYTFVSTIENPAGNLTSKNKIWIGAADQLAYKIETDSPSLVNKGETVHGVTTIEYNIPLQIEPPA